MLNGTGLLNLLTYKFWRFFHVGKYTSPIEHLGLPNKTRKQIAPQKKTPPGDSKWPFYPLDEGHLAFERVT